jgi:hypothetical protein
MGFNEMKHLIKLKTKKIDIFHQDGQWSFNQMEHCMLANK